MAWPGTCQQGRTKKPCGAGSQFRAPGDTGTPFPIPSAHDPPALVVRKA